MKKIFISGFTTEMGNDEGIFNKKQNELLKKGYLIANLFDICKVQYLSYEDYLRFNIRTLTFCDSIYMLKDWGLSRKANLELLIAQNIGLKIIYEES